MSPEEILGIRARFLVELTPAETGFEEIGRLGARCRDACDRLARRGADVRLIRSVFVPEDNRCLLVFEAGSAELVATAVEEAQLEVSRVIEAISLAPNPA